MLNIVKSIINTEIVKSIINTGIVKSIINTGKRPEIFYNVVVKLYIYFTIGYNQIFTFSIFYAIIRHFKCAKV